MSDEIYNTAGHKWWDETVGAFATIRFFINPVRFNYFTRILNSQKEAGKKLSNVLDVGCGGGFLSEEFARAGYSVTGVDPALQSIETAKIHAEKSGLRIDYYSASGEYLPFSQRAFDIVLCCDVLEHVNDLEQVITEISRVIKLGGLFFFDTINKTFASKVAIIKVMQEWSSTAFVPPNTHDWGKFIKPVELSELLARKGFINGNIKGMSIRGNPIRTLLNLRKRAQGKISYEELGRRLQFHESNNLSTNYMGYAIMATNNSDGL